MKTLEQFKVEQMKDKEFATEYEKICLELENEKTEIQAEYELKNNGLKSMLFDVAIKLINSFEKDAKKALEKSKKGYLPTCDIWHLADNVKSVLSTGNQTGEGWFLTAEMLEYMENGILKIRIHI